MTTSDGGSDDSATTAATPDPDPEPGYVVVPRDLVEEYASKGYQPGYAMLKPA